MSKILQARDGFKLLTSRCLDLCLTSTISSTGYSACYRFEFVFTALIEFPSSEVFPVFTFLKGMLCTQLFDRFFRALSAHWSSDMKLLEGLSIYLYGGLKRKR